MPDISTLKETESVLEFLETHEPSNRAIKAHILTSGRNPKFPEHWTGPMIAEFATAEGVEVQALCGYIWIPTQSVGNKEVCQACIDIAHDLMKEEGE